MRATLLFVFASRMGFSRYIKWSPKPGATIMVKEADITSLTRKYEQESSPTAVLRTVPLQGSRNLREEEEFHNDSKVKTALSRKNLRGGSDKRWKRGRKNEWGAASVKADELKSAPGNGSNEPKSKGDRTNETGPSKANLRRDERFSKKIGNQRHQEKVFKYTRNLRGKII